MELFKEAKRIFLAQSHFAHLQRYYRYNRYMWGWRRSTTMIASKVFADDGTPEAIVTTSWLGGRLRHNVERLEDENKPGAEDAGCMYQHDHSAHPDQCERHD
jgi:hypothetical protein